MPENEETREEERMRISRVMLDRRVSLKERGIYMMLNLQPLTVEDIKTCSRECKETISTGLKSLISLGYVVKNTERSENGQFRSFIYDVVK